MKITYQDNFYKTKEEIQKNVNCEIIPVREVIDSQNRLFLEVMIKTSFKNYFIYLSKENIYLNDSDFFKYELCDWTEKYYSIKNELKQLSDFDSLIYIPKEKLIYPILNESNIEIKDTNVQLLDQYLKILKENSISYTNSQITKKSKNSTDFIFTIYLNKNLTLNFRKITDFGRDRETRNFFLITDYKRKKVYFDENLNTLISRLLTNGILTKNQLYSNNNINQDIPEIKNNIPKSLPTIEQFNESILSYTKINNINYETINIDNIQNILNNKKEDIKKRESNYSNLVSLYKQLKNSLEEDLKLLCNNNLKNALMILTNEKNELNKLSVLYLRLTQEHVKKIMSDEIKQTIHGMQVINE
jgi:hypothetical protein